MKNRLDYKLFLFLFVLLATGAVFLLIFFKNGSMPSAAPFDTPKHDLRQKINFKTAPPKFGAVLLWAQALTKDKESDAPAKIIVDYIKILQQLPGKEPVVVFEENYDQESDSPIDSKMGGLYSRSPIWFENDSHSPIFNSKIESGMLEIDLAQTPDSNIHWWTPRVSTQEGARYLVQAKVKIVGNASLQFGCDYWRDFDSVHNGFDKDCQDSNNCEAWSSDWYSDTNGKFITIQAPNFDL